MKKTQKYSVNGTFDALKSKAYGGNGADYKEKVLAIPGGRWC